MQTHVTHFNLESRIVIGGVGENPALESLEHYLLIYSTNLYLGPVSFCYRQTYREFPVRNQIGYILSSIIDCTFAVHKIPESLWNTKATLQHRYLSCGAVAVGCISLAGGGISFPQGRNRISQTQISRTTIDTG